MARFDERGYFEAERALLEKEARTFALRHPDIAANLELDGGRVKDPLIAGLLESFSYLHGRMRRFLDQQFPELVHALFEMAYPLQLRPVPCKTLVHFDMVYPELVDKPIDVPKGTKLFANGLGPQGETYTFTTCWPVLIQPVRLTEVAEDPNAEDDHSITLTLKPLKQETSSGILWDELEFVIHDEASPERAFELFRMLSAQPYSKSGESVHQPLRTIDLRVDGRRLPSRGLELDWCGFENSHNYQPEEHGLVSGRHFARDLFDYAKRYFFFKIKGLDRHLSGREMTELRIDFKFNEPFAPGMRPETGNLLLGCCVAQNLFDMSTEPITTDGKNLEYPVWPDADRDDLEIYSLLSVEAGKSGNNREIRPYYQFEHDSDDQVKPWFYTIRRDNGARRGREFYLRLLATSDTKIEDMADHVVSIHALCTNRDAAERLAPKQLNRIEPGLPESIGVTNLSGASAAAWPPLFGTATWDFVAHLSLDYAELSYLPALRRLLDLYAFGRASMGGYRPSQAVTAVETASDYQIKRGACVQGRKLHMTLDGGRFTHHRGEVAMFARTFAAFLRAYAPINGFIRFQLEDTFYKTGYEHLVWG